MPTINRILVIEEEVLLALAIEDTLMEAGLGDIVHHRTVGEAQSNFAYLGNFELALVEAKLGSAEVVAFAKRLAEAGVAVVVMSADHTATQLFPHAIALAKPFDAAGLLAACRVAKSRIS